MNEYGFRFDPGEQVLRVVHRHIIDLLPPILAFILLVGLSLLVSYAEGNFPGTIPFPSVVVTTMMFIFPVLGVIFLLVGLFNYRHNVLVFTNFHLVQVEQHGFFDRRVSQLQYKHIEDATGDRAGIWPTIFNYGDVEVQTAGAMEKFVFHKAPRPADLADATLQMHELCAEGKDPSEVALAL